MPPPPPPSQARRQSAFFAANVQPSQPPERQTFSLTQSFSAEFPVTFGRPEPAPGLLPYQEQAVHEAEGMEALYRSLSSPDPSPASGASSARRQQRPSSSSRRTTIATPTPAAQRQQQQQGGSGSSGARNSAQGNRVDAGWQPGLEAALRSSRRRPRPRQGRGEVRPPRPEQSLTPSSAARREAALRARANQRTPSPPAGDGEAHHDLEKTPRRFSGDRNVLR